MKLVKVVITILVLLTPVVALSQADLDLFVDEAFENRQRPGVVFDHDAHLDYSEIDQDCSSCHHVYENGKKVTGESSEDMSCNECHSLKSEKRGTTSLMDAYHNQCISCHTEAKKGPLMCGECHTKG